jgi:sec-independent protein translocase protein TatA
MPQLGLPELLIILVIIVVIFGVGRLGEVGGAVGKGIREFKKATTGELDDEKDDTKELAEGSNEEEANS